MRLRLCTFNIENLFARFDFSAFTDARAASYLSPIVQFYGRFGDGDLTRFQEFKQLVQTASLSQDDDKRQHTALAMAEADADVYLVQEVDSIDALRRFLDAYHKKIGVDSYPFAVLHEGNDPRGIDIAAVSRDIRPFLSRSHASVTVGWLKSAPEGAALLDRFAKAKAKAAAIRGRIFRRDCLELEVQVGAAGPVSIFNCHFKSMSGGREESIGMRQLEAVAVREIIRRKFPDPAAALWAITGDLNDYRQIIRVSKAHQPDGSFHEAIDTLAPDEPSGVDPLFADGFGVNLLEVLPPAGRWTHYFPSERHKTQLDYIIASPALAAKVVGEPRVIRPGMPYRVPNSAAVTRYPRVGWDRPKASDHCPLVVEFDI
jgi:endonuclease/exonuclease/phosphatase family metal-dependent hydrolase